MRNIISRTFNTNFVTCLAYDNSKVVSAIVSVPAGFNTSEQAERYIRKNNLVSGKLISVEKIEKVSATYGMEESTFIANAKPFEERSKETRNLVTKNVSGLVGELLYMTENHTIERKTVAVPKAYEKKLDAFARIAAQDFGKGITVENVKTVTSLFGMTEQEFVKLARPMRDNLHFADEK